MSTAAAAAVAATDGRRDGHSEPVIPPGGLNKYHMRTLLPLFTQPTPAIWARYQLPTKGHYGA